jgi:hypothetical protein
MNEEEEMRMRGEGGRRGNAGEGREGLHDQPSSNQTNFSFPGSYIFPPLTAGDVCMVCVGSFNFFLFFHISRSRCPAIPKVTATPLQEEQIPILLHLIIIPIPTEVIIIKMITVLHIITVELDTLNITLLLEAPQNHTAQRSKRIGLLVAPVLRSLSSAKLLFLDREG